MTIIEAHKFYHLKGGAERYVFELSEALEHNGHKVVPFAMQHPENRPTPYSAFFPRFVQTERVRFGLGAFRTLGRMGYSLRAKRNMHALIREVYPDLAHIHNIYVQLSPSILAALHEAHIPTVMTVHDHHLISPQYNIWAKDCGPDYRHAGIIEGTFSKFHKNSYAASFAQVSVHRFHRARRFYERFVNTFITPSEYLRQQLIRGGFDAERIKTIPHGIDPSSVDPRYDHDGYFLFAGRLSEEKGIETIIRMAELIPDKQFKIVGVGPAEARLHALSHGIPNIEFLGFRLGEELKDLYRGAIAVLLPSQVEEVFPLSVLEAMASGTPVIASAVGGVPEQIEDRHTGFLVKPLDLHSWVESAMRLAYDDDLHRRIAKEARLSVETRFHSAKHVEAVENVFRNLIR